MGLDCDALKLYSFHDRATWCLSHPRSTTVNFCEASLSTLCAEASLNKLAKAQFKSQACGWICGAPELYPRARKVDRQLLAGLSTLPVNARKVCLQPGKCSQTPPAGLFLGQAGVRSDGDAWCVARYALVLATSARQYA